MDNSIDFSKILLGQSVLINQFPVGKSGLLDLLSDKALETGHISDRSEFRQALLDREDALPTGLVNGLAFPHAVSNCVSELFACLVVCPDGVEWGSVDARPSQIFFMIGSPVDNVRNYLAIIAAVSRTFRIQGVIDAVLSAGAPELAREILISRLDENARKK